MLLTIVRKYCCEDYTIGDLLIDGDFFCNTLEDRVRDENRNGEFDGDEEKVYGETAIPFGEYKVSLSVSKKFKRLLPYIHNVPEFSGVRIHRGNRAKDSHGCPLVGFNRAKGMVLDSAKTENALMERLKGQKNIQLKII